MNNINDFWNQMASTYKNRQWENTRIARFDYELTKKLLFKYLRPNEKDNILEVGCGPGTWTNPVSASCKKLVAVDISDKMLNNAKAYCKQQKNIQFICGDAINMKHDTKFDKIFSVRSIEYIREKEKLMGKFASLLNENGSLVIITKSKPCLWDLAKNTKCFWQEKISSSDIKKLCKTNGFSEVTVVPVIIRLPIFKNGNRELPLINERLEKKALSIFHTITQYAQNTKGILRKLCLTLSESYLLYAKKAEFA